MKCPKCAQEAGEGRFCRSCGSPTAASPAPAQAASVCPFCGAEVRPGAKFCASCAAPLGQTAAPPAAAVAMTMCVNCGAETPADTKFCKSCGKSMAPAPPPVTPDLLPTVMMATPLPPAAPNPAPPEPPPAPRPSVAPPPAPPPPRKEPQPAPTPVAKSEPPRPAAAPATRPTPGSNKILVIASVVVLALLAAGLVYKFVLHKTPAQSAPVAESPVAEPPAAATPADASSQTGASDAEPATPADQANPPADSTAAEATPAGNSSPSGAAVPAPARAPKRSPATLKGPGYTQAHASALQALAASQYLTPADGSALFWARKAKALGDPGADQIEQQVFTKQMADISTARQSHLYDQAQAQLYQLATNFPDHTELRQLQDDIHQEQQHYTQQTEEKRRQAELLAQTKKFPVQHRHGVGGSFCTGIITVTPDGVAKYDCTTGDSGGRCEHVIFAAGSLKEVKLKGDGSLHIATHQQGNFDFSGADFTIKDAASTLAPLVKH